MKDNLHTNLITNSSVSINKKKGLERKVQHAQSETATHRNENHHNQNNTIRYNPQQQQQELLHIQQQQWQQYRQQQQWENNNIKNTLTGRN